MLPLFEIHGVGFYTVYRLRDINIPAPKPQIATVAASLTKSRGCGRAVGLGRGGWAEPGPEVMGMGGRSTAQRIQTTTKHMVYNIK